MRITIIEKAIKKLMRIVRIWRKNSYTVGGNVN
jgi:hypothetical protein